MQCSLFPCMSVLPISLSHAQLNQLIVVMAASHSGANSSASSATNGSKVVVALYQACSTPGEVATNLKMIKEQMKRARLVGASLVIFPEMFTTGYYLPEGTSGFKQLAEPHDGYCFEEL